MQILLTENNLGVIIKDFRKKRGMSQQELGAVIGVDQTVISRVERGAHSLRIDTLFKILGALDLELLMQPRKDIATLTAGDQW